MSYDIRQAQQYFQQKMAFTTGPHELLAKLEAKADDIAIVDVRYPGDFRKSHIPGAVTLPKGKWHETAALPKDRTLVLYCYNQQCHLAAEAAVELLAQGFRVVEMEGGFATWEANSSPVVTAAPKAA
jgi:rhodanese-related sulfurtransferase